jgi:hypothetical protein
VKVVGYRNAGIWRSGSCSTGDPVLGRAGRPDGRQLPFSSHLQFLQGAPRRFFEPCDTPGTSSQKGAWPDRSLARLPVFRLLLLITHPACDLDPVSRPPRPPRLGPALVGGSSALERPRSPACGWTGQHPATLSSLSDDLIVSILGSLSQEDRQAARGDGWEPGAGC